MNVSGWTRAGAIFGSRQLDHARQTGGIRMRVVDQSAIARNLKFVAFHAA